MKLELLATFVRSTKNCHVYLVQEVSPVAPFFQTVYIDRASIQGDPTQHRVVVTVEVQAK